uniref:Uncharacterized protein n=1 Tax=Arundo donax TaxID=35708 RepID=A0A0A9AWT1_ARUDO
MVVIQHLHQSSLLVRRCSPNPRALPRTLLHLSSRQQSNKQYNHRTNMVGLEWVGFGLR